MQIDKNSLVNFSLHSQIKVKEASLPEIGNADFDLETNGIAFSQLTTLAGMADIDMHGFIITEILSGRTIVRIDGRLDDIKSVDLQKTLNQLIEKEKFLLLDFSNVSYISNKGLLELTSTRRKLKTVDGGMGLINPQPNVTQVLEMSGLSSIIPIYQTTQEAIDAFSNKS